MSKKQKISLTICSPKWLGKGVHFEIGVSGLSEKYAFEIMFPLLLPQINVGGLVVTEDMNRSPLFQQDFISAWQPAQNIKGKIVSQAFDEISPIFEVLLNASLTNTQHLGLIDYLVYDTAPEGKPLIIKANIKPQTEIDSGICLYLGDILKGVLEGVGYVVEIETIKYYFASPTSTAYLAPAFGLGLQKDVKPIDIKKGYETTYTYLSYNKPNTKNFVQLNLLDVIPEERLQRIEKQLKENLTPYGLKCLYLVMRECDHNNRRPWFELDTNRCLDVMGYRRMKNKQHQTTNKKRFYRELKALTQIDFIAEGKAPKRGAKGREYVVKLNGPLLQISHTEVWEVNEGDEPKESDKIYDGIRVFIDPGIYSFIERGWYTVLPDAFLKIDAQRRGHAIQLYQYISNQWRIGWHLYQGVLKQPIREIMEGSGAISGYPKKRKNLQREFVGKIIENLRWLKGQDVFWIKSVSIKTEGRKLLDTEVTVTMTDNHPLQSSLGVKKV